MSRGITDRLLDTIDAIDKIEHYISGLTWSEFQTQRGIQLIVERLLITVGEALDKAEDLDKTLGTRIPGIGQAIATGKQILSSTSGVDPALLWEIGIDRAPRLRNSLRLAVEDYR
jgi:uncharacterized protein with HEPN domain